MTEDKIWQKLKSGIDLWFYADRIESRTNNGIPDVAFSVEGRHGWMELKASDVRTDSGTVKFKKPLDNRQAYWIRSRGEHAGNIYVLAGIEIMATRKQLFFLLHWRDALSTCDHNYDLAWYKNVSIWRGEDSIDGAGLYEALI